MSKKILILIILLFYCNNSYSNDYKNIIDLTDINQENVVKNVQIKDIKKINRANTVVLQALNKITAKSYNYEIALGDKIEFERLIIEPLFCWKSSPADIDENKVLLKITENKLNKTQEEIFYGWMFSSSPSISSVEHSMYDITILDCKNIEDIK